MNITKSIAEQVALRMIQPIAEHISNENDTLNEIVNEIAIRSIPKQVYNTYKEYPRFFITTRCVYLVNGTQITRVEVKNWFPSASSTGGLNVPCKPEEMETVSEIQNRIQELRNEKSRTYNSIVNTLISLKTSKKVMECFPEAYEYIKAYENKTTNEVSLPVETIMNTINKYKNN